MQLLDLQFIGAALRGGAGAAEEVTFDAVYLTAAGKVATNSRAGAYLAELTQHDGIQNACTNHVDCISVSVSLLYTLCFGATCLRIAHQSELSNFWRQNLCFRERESNSLQRTHTHTDTRSPSQCVWLREGLRVCVVAVYSAFCT